MADEAKTDDSVAKTNDKAVTAKQKTDDRPKRYIVEVHTTFDLLGQTCTMREGQILTDATEYGKRELAYARQFNVPLRELVPISS